VDNANVGCVQGNIADRQAQAHAQRVGMYMPDMCISTYIYIYKNGHVMLAYHGITWQAMSRKCTNQTGYTCIGQAVVRQMRGTGLAIYANERYEYEAAELSVLI
jgi:hypothetical protein